MFVLGVDPGLTRCGYGLVEGALQGAETFRAVRAGTIETDRHRPTSERLGEVHQSFARLLDEVRPDVVVVERIFYQRNAKTAIPVAQASGVAVGLAASRGIPVREFTAQEVKLAVSGYGAASKSQVQEMVARLLRLSSVPEPPDAADALAAAITYFVVARTESRLVAGAVK